MRKRVLLIVGHNEKSQGCLCPHYENKNINTEWKYCKNLAEIIAKMTSNVKYDVFIRNKDSGGYKQEMKDVIDRAKKFEKENGFKYDLALEIHLNSMPTDDPNGAETIYYKDNENGKKYSDLFKEVLNEKKQIKKRDGYAVLQPDDHNGARGVCTSPWTYVLIEPFFTSNKNDAEKFETSAQIDELANLIMMSVDKFFKWKDEKDGVVTQNTDTQKDVKLDEDIEDMLKEFGEDSVKEYCLMNAFRCLSDCKNKKMMTENINKVQIHLNTIIELEKRMKGDR